MPLSCKIVIYIVSNISHLIITPWSLGQWCIYVGWSNANFPIIFNLHCICGSNFPVTWKQTTILLIQQLMLMTTTKDKHIPMISQLIYMNMDIYLTSTSSKILIFMLLISWSQSSILSIAFPWTNKCLLQCLPLLVYEDMTFPNRKIISLCIPLIKLVTCLKINKV